MRINIALLLILACSLSLQACKDKATAATEKRNTDIIPVKTIQLSRTTGPAVIPVSGQFTTDDETFLSFKTSGVIRKLYVKEGDPVRAGQLLATLNLTEINAQVSQAQLGLEKAQRDYNRVQHLHDDSVATLEQLQNAKTALDLAKQQLVAAQFNQGYSEIRAAKSGFVLRKLANEGQVVSTGTAVFQTNGAQAGSWLLRVGLSDKEWAAIHTGDKAEVRTDALPDQVLTATVTRKSEGVDAGSGTFIVDLKIAEYKTPIASGMYGKAVITTAAAAGMGTSWSIPYDALLDADGSNGYVFITNDNKTARKVRIVIAGMDKDHVLVSQGLEGAQALIVSGSAYLGDSSAITVQPIVANK